MSQIEVLTSNPDTQDLLPPLDDARSLFVIPSGFISLREL
jgi:hypothetical protein